MKYAKIYFNISKNANLIQDKEYLTDSSYMYVMTDDDKNIVKMAIEEANEASQVDGVPYEYEIKYLTAVEYNEIKKHELECKIKNDYRKFVGDDKSISIREYNKRIKDIDEYNKALDYYFHRNSIQKCIRSIVDSSKLSLKEFDEYVEKIYKAIGSDEYTKLIDELKII